MDMKSYEGQKVFVRLNSGRFYTGQIIEVNYLGKNQFGVDLFLFLMIDKFGSKITFSNTEINLLEEER
jgi:hypothetical protein